MSKRNRAYFRKMRKRAIHRKERIINSYRADNPPAFYDIKEFDPYGKTVKYEYGQIFPSWCVKHKGQLSKGKIHCSCELCRSHDTSISDKRRLMSMADELSEYYDDNEYSIDSSVNAEITRIKKRKNSRNVGFTFFTPPAETKEKDMNYGHIEYLYYLFLKENTSRMAFISSGKNAGDFLSDYIDNFCEHYYLTCDEKDYLLNVTIPKIVKNKKFK